MDLSRRPVDLAVALVRGGAEVVVVGGTARLLRGEAHRPRDLDVVVAQEAVPALVQALGALGETVCADALLRCGESAVRTSYGPLDVFVRRRPAASGVLVDGVCLAVRC